MDTFLQIRRNVAVQKGKTAVRISLSFGCEGKLQPARLGGHAAAPMPAPVRVALEDPQARPPKKPRIRPRAAAKERRTASHGITRSRIQGDRANPRTRSQLAAKVPSDDRARLHPRQAAYDLQETARQGPAEQTRRHRRCHAPPQVILAITALIVLRDQVIAPILAGAHAPRRGANPTTGASSTSTTKPAPGHEGAPDRLRHRRITSQPIDNVLPTTVLQAPKPRFSRTVTWAPRRRARRRGARRTAAATRRSGRGTCTRRP